MSAEDIRSSINLLAHSEQCEKTPADSIDEAAPMGFLKKLATKAASLIDKSREGELETGEIANAWYNEYTKYLRQIGRGSADEGTVGDLFTFFTGTGFNLDSVKNGIYKGFGINIASKKDLAYFKNTKHISTDKLTKTFLYIMQNQKEKPAASLKPEYWGEPKKHKPVSKTTTPTATHAAKPAVPPAVTDTDVQNILQAALGTRVSSSQIAALKTALKNAGLIS